MLIAQNKLIGEKILTKNPYTLFIDHISMTINSTILYRRISQHRQVFGYFKNKSNLPSVIKIFVGRQPTSRNDNNFTSSHIVADYLNYSMTGYVGIVIVFDGPYNIRMTFFLNLALIIYLFKKKNAECNLFHSQNVIFFCNFFCTQYIPSIVTFPALT